MKLLILRPQPGADASAQRALDAGIAPIAIPLFAVQAVAWEPVNPAQYDAIIFTSPNALRYGGQGLAQLTALPAYAVGAATAKLANAAGFTIAATGQAGAAALVQTAMDMGHKQLLWLTGKDHSAFSIADDAHISKRIVYHAQRLAPPPELQMLLAHPVAITLHSARAARYFAKICDDWGVSRAQIILACLSPAIAQAAGGGWADILIADQPNDAEIMAKVKSYFTSIANAP